MDERAAWDLFWSYDRLSSFGTGSGSGNYGQAIAAGWRDYFAGLPAGARVLDLCTGNGAIAVMAVEAGKDLQVTGADLASVRPAAFVSKGKESLGKIDFHGGVPAEEVPFPDGSFDAVVSQYGVEYSDMARSVPEAVRVLAPSGSLRFACHAVEGTVVADTKRAIADADFLIDHVDFTARAADCISAVLAIERGRATTPFAQVEAQEKYRLFRQALRALAERAQTAADAAMLASVHQSLTDLFQQRQKYSEADIGERIVSLRTEIEAHRERQRALLAAAVTSEQLADVAKELEDQDFKLKLGEQRDGADLIGHVLEARR